MSKNTKQELFCTKCSLQFGNFLAKFNTNFAFNLHLSTVHKKEIKSSPNKGQKTFKCEFCGNRFATNKTMNQIIALVHEWKNPFKCESCDYSCAQKGHLYQHVTTTLVTAPESFASLADPVDPDWTLDSPKTTKRTPPKAKSSQKAPYSGAKNESDKAHFMK